MPTEDIKWIAFFSQTGAEIADIAESIGRWPDRIITNENVYDRIEDGINRCKEKLQQYNQYFSSLYEF